VGDEPDMTLAERTLRQMRIIHFAFLFAAVAYVAVPFLSPSSNQHGPPVAVVLAIGVLGLATLAGSVFIRGRMVQPASEALRINPEDGGAAARWRSGVILSMAFCETVALFGLVLRYSGARWSTCGIFYGVGIFLLLAWAPRLELSPR